MENILPRFEFRTFAQNLGHVEEVMRRLSSCGERVRESSEIYIISRFNNDNNAKIRNNKIDIKVFVKEEKGMQQWKPRMKGEFPMNAKMIHDNVFPAFGVSVPELKRSVYTLEQYLEEIIKPHPDLVTARVFKHRFGFIVNGCPTEIAKLLINDIKIQTVAVESEDIEAVLITKEMLELQEYENVNYLLAIKRIINMEPQ